MGPCVHDGAVNDLADRPARPTGRSKVQAVREATELRLGTSRAPAGVRERIARLQARAREAGGGGRRSLGPAADLA